jgi:hypothetical protein
MGSCPTCGRKPKSLRTPTRNRMLNAHLRDIARFKFGGMEVPERVFQAVVDDFKRTDIWPRYSDAEPDTFTGEVLYRPKSRADLTQAEAVGIVAWLEHFMVERGIPSNAPKDHWTDNDEGYPA